jgi:hypothetical protein
MHVDEWDEVALVAQQQKRQNLDALVFFMAVRVTTSMAAAHIYREDLPRVIASCNRVGLCLSKCIKHGLVLKPNGKRGREPARLWTGLTPPRQGERVRVCVSPFLLSSTHLQVYREHATL